MANLTIFYSTLVEKHCIRGIRVHIKANKMTDKLFGTYLLMDRPTVEYNIHLNHMNK